MVWYQRKFAQEKKVPRLDLLFLKNEEIEANERKRKREMAEKQLRKQTRDRRTQQKIKMEAVAKQKKREAAELHRQETRAWAMLIQQGTLNKRLR